MNPGTVKGPGELTDPADWRLQEGSPLINMGLDELIEAYEVEHDFEGYRRINYGIVDIGISEFRLGSHTPVSPVESPEVWLADTIYITEDMTLDSKVTIVPGVVVCFKGN